MVDMDARRKRFGRFLDNVAEDFAAARSFRAPEVFIYPLTVFVEEEPMRFETPEAWDTFSVEIAQRIAAMGIDDFRAELTGCAPSGDSGFRCDAEFYARMGAREARMVRATYFTRSDDAGFQIEMIRYTDMALPSMLEWQPVRDAMLYDGAEGPRNRQER